MPLLLPVTMVLAWIYARALPAGERWGRFDSSLLLVCLLTASGWVMWTRSASIVNAGPIYPELLAAGLIDELVLMTFPLVLGRGKRMFGVGTPVRQFEMIDHWITDKGTVVATYRPGGALPPYPAEAPIPILSEREIARRHEIAAIEPQRRHAGGASRACSCSKLPSASRNFSPHPARGAEVLAACHRTRPD